MSRSKSDDLPLGWEPERLPWGWRDLLALFVWTLAVVAFFWKAVSLAEAFFYFDITEINYPYRDFLAREIRLGRFSRWFPGLYCGQPLYSESQAGYWHPLKYLFYPWLETWQAFNLDTVASVWLTGLGTYGWLRRHVGQAGALTGAALFGMSGFVWAHLIHTSMTNALVSVPLVIWGLEVTWDGGRWRGAVLGSLALACQVFAGHLQDTLLTGALVGVYSLYRACTEPTPRQGFRALAVACTLVTLGVAIAAVQWIPSKELLDRSPRAGGLTWKQLTYGSWHPELLPTLAVREAYGTRARDTDWMDGFYPYHEMNAYLGLIGIALAVVGCGASRNRWVGFWLIASLLGVLLMLGKFTFLFDYLHRVPILGSSRIPVRFHLWVSLAVAALAAVGVDRLGRSGQVRLRWGVGLALLIVVASIPILMYVYAPVWQDSRRWATLYHQNRYRWLGRDLTIASIRTVVLCTSALTIAGAAARSISPRARRIWASLLPLVVILDLLGSHLFDAPTITPTYWTTPPETVKVLKEDPSLQRIFGVADRSAGEPGYASEAVDFLSIREPLDWSIAPVWGLSSTSGETPIIPRRLVEYTDNAEVRAGRFDVDGVSHILSTLTLSGIDKSPRRVGSVYIHKNSTAQPRARLMGRPIYASDEADASAQLKSAGIALRDRVVIEDPSRPLDAGAEVSGEARIVVDDPEHVVVDTDCTTPAYLVLADSFDPGWSATVDGQPATIRPAFVAFRAVFLEGGQHRVEFRYRPAGFRLGLSITAAGSLIALLLLVGFWKAPTLTHSDTTLSWPKRWPLMALLVMAVVIAASAVGIGADGRPRCHSRWNGSWHTFTWGAGLEAINQVRPSVGR